MWKPPKNAVSNRARTSLIRDSLWSNQPMIRQWVTHGSPNFDFWFDLIFDPQVKQNQTESKLLKLNRKSKCIKIQMNCESKWIKIKIKLNHFNIFPLTSSKFGDDYDYSGRIWYNLYRIRLLSLGQLINFRNKNSACSVDISQVFFIIDYLRNRFSIRLWKTARGRLFGPYNAIFQ